MNRKATSKKKQKIDAYVAKLSPYDNVMDWVKGTLPCPWTQVQIDAFQTQIDSAFGAEKAFVLAWSLDRTYWDEIYMDEWFADGQPKGKPQKIPLLLFKQIPIDDKDFMLVSTPRWMILEKIHRSQFEASWEDSMWMEDEHSLGGRKRVRRKKPPEFLYQPLMAPLGTIARHESSTIIGQPNPCCERMWHSDKSICYGQYRPPAEQDLRGIRKMRENMDAEGVAQRADKPRDVKVLERARLQHRYMLEQAEKRQVDSVREMIRMSPEYYMGDIMKNYGASAKQMDEALNEAFKETV